MHGARGEGQRGVLPERVQGLLHAGDPEPAGFVGGKFVWAQDKAPSHSAKSTRQFFAKEFPGVEILQWPPSSPDLSPLGYWLWGVAQQKVPPCGDMASLKAAVVQAFRELQADPDVVRRAVEQEFVFRLRQCLAHDGGHFEHALQLARRRRVAALRRPAAAAAPMSVEAARPLEDA